jgi:tetratricopeptide (TPR) repeat protein
VQTVNAVFPASIEMETWPVCRRYLSQSQSCVVLIQDFALTMSAATSLLWRTALYLHAHGLSEQAGQLLQQAGQIDKQSTRVIASPDPALLNNLGVIYTDQGNYEQAEPLLQQALRIRKKGLGGPTSPEVADSLNNLANLYEMQGKYEQAESLYQQASETSQQTPNKRQLHKVREGALSAVRKLFRRGPSHKTS